MPVGDPGFGGAHGCPAEQQGPETGGKAAKRGRAAPDGQRNRHDVAAIFAIDRHAERDGGYREENAVGEAGEKAELSIRQPEFFAKGCQHKADNRSVDSMTGLRKCQNTKDIPAILFRWRALPHRR